MRRLSHFFRSDQDEHLDIPATTVRLRRPLGETAEITGAYFYSHADLGFDGARSSAGTVDVATLPRAADRFGKPRSLRRRKSWTI